MRLAIFDIDGTLVGGTSSERLFWRYLLRHGELHGRQMASFLLFAVRYLPTGGVHTLKKNKAYLAGLPVDRVADCARRFVDEVLSERLFAPCVRRLEEHLALGDHVVLLSGTLDYVAGELGERLGAADTLATVCAQRNGRFLASPPEVHPFGAAKLVLARQLAARRGLSLEQAAAYGDSRHDLPLLEAVGEPVAVSPDPGLLQVATSRGWELILPPAKQPAGYQ